MRKTMRRLGPVTAMHFLLFVAPAYSQNSSKPCAAVTPKNKQEALMMETASDKKGCWVRDTNGNLAFVSSVSPESNYKPVIPNPTITKGRRHRWGHLASPAPYDFRHHGFVMWRANSSLCARNSLQKQWTT